MAAVAAAMMGHARRPSAASEVRGLSSAGSLIAESRPGTSMKKIGLPGLVQPVEGIMSPAIQAHWRAGTPNRKLGDRKRLPKSTSEPAMPLLPPATPSRPSSTPSSQAAESALSQEAMRKSRSSGPLRQFDHRLATEYRAQSPKSRAQRPPSALRSPPPSAAATALGSSNGFEKGLSEPALFENFKKQRYQMELDKGALPKKQSARRNSHGGGDSPTGTEAEDLAEAVKPEVFFESFQAVSAMLEDCAKSLRCEAMDKGKREAARAAAERAAEQRRMEEALRKARKKESEARQPAKKVQLRLENKRRFEADASSGKEIPMMQLTVQGAHGPELHTVVDVKQLQQKMRGIEGGVSVDDMLEEIRRQGLDTLAQSSAYLALPGSLSQSAPSICSSTGRSFFSQPFEDKAMAAKLKREQHAADEMLRRLDAMRSEGQKCSPLPFSFRLHDEVSALVEEGGKVLALAPPGFEGIRMAKSQEPQALAKALIKRASASGKTEDLGEHVRKLVGDLCGDRGLAHMPETKHEKTMRKTLQRQVVADKSVTQRTKAQKKWINAKALVQWLRVFFKKRKAYDSTTVICSVLRSIEEWKKVRRRAKLILAGVKTIQAAVRGYFEKKTERLRAMSESWKVVEDGFLASYYAEVASDADKQPKKGKAPAVRQSKKEAAKAKAAPKEAQPDLLDWKKYRLPEKERQVLLSLWYKFVLKKKIRSEAFVLSAMKQTIQAEREIRTFLKELSGSDDVDDLLAGGSSPSSGARGGEGQGGSSQALRRETDSKAREFFDYSDDLLLQLIEIGAQALVTTAPFESHPANKETQASGSGQTSGRPLEERISAALVKLGEHSSQDGGGGGGNLASLARLKNKQQQQKRTDGNAGDDTSAAQQEAAASKRLNIEEVFDDFMPKLKEIREEQQLEYYKLPKLAVLPAQEATMEFWKARGEGSS
eukprot:TRINITY_DN22106_c0_g1_i1.p1 TRINITY_DN22106_c0_g1~~TRINITY_DN22106_c0_g1_i1.p1  ORF type:complete len:939 (+),score=315.04 TRINITY_DN22106_c0_g1_i1:80-2896(+)